MRNVINHAPTAHAIPFLNTKMNTLVKYKSVAMRQPLGHDLSCSAQTKNNAKRDSSPSAPAKNANIRCENLLQSVQLFCNKKKVFANKPSILMFAKNRQTTDNQSFAQNNR